MKCKSFIAGAMLVGVLALVTGVLTSAAAALAKPGPTVTVRVEGKTKTLLAQTTARTHKGWIRKGGTPKGACPATSAAGALNVATKHHWNGKYNSQFGALAVTKILGETYQLTATSPYYWSVWVNDRYAQSGVCGIKLHHGEHLLFAVEPNSSTYWYPLGLTAPDHAKAGQSFQAKVTWFDTSGKRSPLAGAQITGAGATVTTDSQGIAHITPAHAGTLTLRATDNGYIRSVPVRVTVS